MKKPRTIQWKPFQLNKWAQRRTFQVGQQWMGIVWFFLFDFFLLLLNSLKLLYLLANFQWLLHYLICFILFFSFNSQHFFTWWKWLFIFDHATELAGWVSYSFLRFCLFFHSFLNDAIHVNLFAYKCKYPREIQSTTVCSLVFPVGRFKKENIFYGCIGTSVSTQSTINNVFLRRSICTYVTYIWKFSTKADTENHSHNHTLLSAWKYNGCCGTGTGSSQKCIVKKSRTKFLSFANSLDFFRFILLMLSCQSISLDSIFVRAQLIRLKNESKAENPVQCETEFKKWEKYSNITYLQCNTNSLLLLFCFLCWNQRDIISRK